MTKDEIKNAMEMFEGGPDGAFWHLVADYLGCDVEDVMATVADDPEFFGYVGVP